MAEKTKTIKHIDEKSTEYKTSSEYLVTLANVEIRKAEVVDRSFTAKDGKQVDASFLQVTVLDDEHDIIAYLQDKDMTRAELYKRGTIGTFLLSVSVDLGFKGRTKIYVADFKPAEESED